jgi:hypothetical protein
MKLRNIGMSVVLVAGLSACASMTPTREVTEGYRIYDIQGVTDHSAIAANVKAAMQKNADKVTFTNNIPPHPLPEKPGRFSTTNPFANSNLGALMAAQGGSLKIPKCDNSTFTATSHDNFEGAENTTFFVCLLPYAGGYHMDVYYTFTKVSGGFGAQALGRALAQSMVGDSSQFIPRTLAALESAAQEAGGKVSVVETYP